MPDQPAGQRRDKEVGKSGPWIWLIALVPIACCAAPLLFAAVASAGAGVIVGGVTGAVLVFGACVVVFLALRRRNRP